MTERNMMTECRSCQYRRTIPGDMHISCANPDPEMTGNEHGIRKGWFFYPWCFDPVWKTKDCANFEQVGAKKMTSDIENKDICQCQACQKLFKEENAVHYSSCSVHNEPASPNGECDCKHCPIAGEKP
jgi:hypothetical protein